jgi:hypothetical protein
MARRTFGEWLRSNSERYLLEAAQEEMARRYLGRGGPVGAKGPVAFFWRRVYVPVYRRIPWSVRHRIIRTMPGSHRRHWQGRRQS